LATIRHIGTTTTALDVPPRDDRKSDICGQLTLFDNCHPNASP
jgi:hypothetical protein